MTSSALPIPDAELLERHLSGDSDAFRVIVERHQGAVCAVAYSICGNRVRSEDIAQDTFIAGWKQANHLKERSKLRSWLCGIARNLAHNALRRDSREPGAYADELPLDAASPEALPSEQAMASDREALLWSAIEGLPDMYREPLVLFYRERKDAASVARALDLTEEAVRQRLSRARTMLAGRMTSLVEETLSAGTPSHGFAAGVLLALPSALPVAAGSTPLGGSVATVGLFAKLVPTLAALPFLLSGLTNYLSFRAAYAEASPEERQAIVRARAIPLMISGLIVTAFVSPFRLHASGSSPWPSLAVLALVIPLLVSLIRAQRRLPPGLSRRNPAFEYCSRVRLLGLPLVHVKTGGPWSGRSARGWIAISDGRAIGVLFASAPLSLAPIAMGGVPVGLLSIGGVAIGAYAVGIGALGVCAAGLFSVGYALSLGLLAVSHAFAHGVIAIAPHANDALARAAIDPSPLSLVGRQSLHIGTWGCLFAWLPPLIVILVHARWAPKTGSREGRQA